MKPDFTNLRELLKNESYPHRYVHKFIGLATPAFSESLSILEADFPTAQRVGERKSGGDRFIAYTYELHAESPEDIVRLLEATHLLADLKMIL